MTCGEGTPLWEQHPTLCRTVLQRPVCAAVDGSTRSVPQCIAAPIMCFSCCCLASLPAGALRPSTANPLTPTVPPPPGSHSPEFEMTFGKKATMPYCVSLAWSADGSTLYAGYTDGQIRVFVVSHGM